MLSASLLAAGMLTGTAAGASPRDIYLDFVQHGKLSGQYSRAELEAALKDALVEGYGAPAGAALTPAVQGKLREVGVLGAHSELPRARAAGVLPFTGVDLGLIALGGTGLLLLGAALRRLGKNE
jgi:hypothetical protein